MTTIRTAIALPVALIAAPLFAGTAGFNEGTRRHRQPPRRRRLICRLSPFAQQCSPHYRPLREPQSLTYERHN